MPSIRWWSVALVLMETNGAVGELAAMMNGERRRRHRGTTKQNE